MIPRLEHYYVETNRIRLHVVQAGPENRPLMILLYGFWKMPVMTQGTP